MQTAAGQNLTQGISVLTLCYSDTELAENKMLTVKRSSMVPLSGWQEDLHKIDKRLKLVIQNDVRLEGSVILLTYILKCNLRGKKRFCYLFKYNYL